jgi:hypothetical protein
MAEDLTTTRRTVRMSSEASRALRTSGWRLRRACSTRSFMESAAPERTVIRPPNGSHAKLCGQGPRAEARAARRLPRMTFEEPSRELQPP